MQQSMSIDRNEYISRIDLWKEDGQLTQIQIFKSSVAQSSKLTRTNITMTGGLGRAKNQQDQGMALSIKAGQASSKAEHFRINVPPVDKSMRNQQFVFTGYYVEGQPVPKLVDVGFSVLE